MVCGPIGWGFESLYLPMLQFLKIKFLLTNLDLQLKTPIYFFRAYNVILWQEGLLIDFLQKLTINKLLSKIIINSFIVVNENFFFEPLSKIITQKWITVLVLSNLTIKSALRPMFLTFLIILMTILLLGFLFFL